jgi:hypothetical protein
VARSAASCGGGPTFSTITLSGAPLQNLLEARLFVADSHDEPVRVLTNGPVGEYIGHSSVHMTERYRHLVKGQRAQDAAAVDALLAAARTGARPGAQGG